MSEPGDEDLGDQDTLVCEARFAIVPEWVIDAEISDCAYRLYSVLLRYGQTSGQRMPGRALLARRLHKTSKDTVDRALKELEAIGAVRVQRRRGPDQQNLTNRYHLMSTAPRDQRQDDPEGGGRKFAATPGRTDAATPSRISAATLAANLRPNPEALTERTPPPSSALDENRDGGGGAAAQPKSSAPVDLVVACGIEDLDALAHACQQLRRRLGRSTARWTAPRLAEVLHETVVVRGWPAKAAPSALLAVAADPATQGPMRLACPGPWWDQVRGRSNGASLRDASEDAELTQLEARLGDADGQRVWAQQRARADLTSRELPINRLTVARRACELLDEAEYAPC